MAEFDYISRRNITLQRNEDLEKRIQKLSGHDKELALEIMGRNVNGSQQVTRIAGQFYRSEGKKPSEWFRQKGMLPGSRVHKGLLDVFVPKC